MFDDVVEELASAGVFHYEIEFPLGFYDLGISLILCFGV